MNTMSAIKRQFRAAYGAYRFTIAVSGNKAAGGFVWSMCDAIAGAPIAVHKAAAYAVCFRHWERYNGIQSWPAETRHLAINNALRCAQVRRWGFSSTPAREVCGALRSHQERTKHDQG